MSIQEGSIVEEVSLPSLLIGLSNSLYERADFGKLNQTFELLCKYAAIKKEGVDKGEIMDSVESRYFEMDSLSESVRLMQRDYLKDKILKDKSLTIASKEKFVANCPNN